jgi:hypothetical protein
LVTAPQLGAPFAMAGPVTSTTSAAASPSPWSETNDTDGLAHMPSSVGWAAGAVRAGDGLGHGAVVFRCLSATGSHSEQSDHLRQVGEYAGGALSAAQRQFPDRMDTYRSRTTR